MRKARRLPRRERPRPVFHEVLSPVRLAAEHHGTPAVTRRGLRRFAICLAARRRTVVHSADLGERDPDYIRDNLPWLWLLASAQFRGEVRGLGNIPDRGPALLVGNHSGGNMIPDTGILRWPSRPISGPSGPSTKVAHNLGRSPVGRAEREPGSAETPRGQEGRWR